MLTRGAMIHQDPTVEDAHYDEDSDVVAEARRVADGGADSDIVRLSNLRKVYAAGGRTKVAVRSLSFGIPMGEVRRPLPRPLSRERCPADPAAGVMDTVLRLPRDQRRGQDLDAEHADRRHPAVVRLGMDRRARHPDRPGRRPSADRILPAGAGPKR